MRAKKIKEENVDDAVSIAVRNQAGWKCVFGFYDFCGYGKRVFPPPGKGLTASHYHGRTLRSTRFDFENVDSACIACHRFLEGRKTTNYKQWKERQLGPERFKAMERRAMTPKYQGYSQKEYQEIIKKCKELST